MMEQSQSMHLHQFLLTLQWRVAEMRLGDGMFVVCIDGALFQPPKVCPCHATASPFSPSLEICTSQGRQLIVAIYSTIHRERRLFGLSPRVVLIDRLDDLRQASALVDVCCVIFLPVNV